MKLRIWQCLALEVAAGVAASILNFPAAQAASSEGVATNHQMATVAAFQFGTADSATRAGFTKITVKDTYAAEKGYGFESVEGLLAFDRGGSEIVWPKDEYSARVYGAYRRRLAPARL